MNSFILILIAYIFTMYFNFQKIKKNDIEIIRFRDQIARFTFLQFAFAFYDYINNKFSWTSLANKIMISHIGVASFVFVKEYVDKIKLK